MTNFPNEILNIGLHSWPVKSLSCQVYHLLSTKVTHFLVQLFEHKVAIFFGQNNLSIETISSEKNSSVINPKLLPLMKELSCVKVLAMEILTCRQLPDFRYWITLSIEASLVCACFRSICFTVEAVLDLRIVSSLPNKPGPAEIKVNQLDFR